MHTQTIQITGLPPETVKILIEKAQEAGTTPEDFARSLIEQGLYLREKSFDEILAPFRRQVKASGIADNELDEVFREARREVCRDKQEKESA